MSWFNDKEQLLEANVIGCETLLKKKKKKNLEKFRFREQKLLVNTTHMYTEHIRAIMVKFFKLKQTYNLKLALNTIMSHCSNP